MSVTKNTNQLLYRALDIYVTSTSGTMLSGNTLGSIKDAKVTIGREYLEHESGFPASIDKVVPIKESIKIEGTIEELSPANIALALSLYPGSYSSTSGTFYGGNYVLPAEVQAWAVTRDTGGAYITFKLWKANSKSTFEVNPANGEWAGIGVELDGLTDSAHAAAPLWQMEISGSTPFSG